MTRKNAIAVSKYIRLTFLLACVVIIRFTFHLLENVNSLNAHVQALQFIRSVQAFPPNLPIFSNAIDLDYVYNR